MNPNRFQELVHKLNSNLLHMMLMGYEQANPMPIEETTYNLESYLGKHITRIRKIREILDFLDLDTDLRKVKTAVDLSDIRIVSEGIRRAVNSC